MPRDNGQSRYSGPNKYQRENRSDHTNAAEATSTRSTNLPVPATPTLDLTQAGDWRARRPPEAATYLPSLGESWRSRSQGRQLAEAFHTATNGANAGTQYYKALERFEEAKQDLELAHQRRGLVPLKVARERLHHEQQLLQAVAGFDAVKEARELQRIDQARQRQLDQDDFEIAQLRRRAERQEQAARIAAAEAQLAYAQRVGQQRGEAELYRAEEEALRNHASAEGERRAQRHGEGLGWGRCQRHAAVARELEGHSIHPLGSGPHVA